MKHILMIIFISCTLLLTACTSENPVEQPNSEAESAESTITTTASIAYYDKNEIDIFMSNYISEFSEGHISHSEADPVIKSSEGGMLMIYRNSSDEIIRQKQEIYGSVGKSTYNSYYLPSGKIYFTRLTEIYDGYSISSVEGTLYYSFEEFLLDDEKVYIINSPHGSITEYSPEENEFAAAYKQTEVTE